MTATRVAVVIPALDEEGAIGLVLGAIPRDLAHDVIVVDNGSRDRTAAVARALHAHVVSEGRRGYGQACIRGIAALREPRAGSPAGAPPDVVVFLDADFSDHPDEMPLLLEPVLAGRADMAIGSRALGPDGPGALLPQARFGNRLAVFLLRVLFGARFTDLGPFRAIRFAALESLGMADRDFGWTVEMQARAALARLRCAEVPVRYRRRVGVSKITGTLRGTVLAGFKILTTILRFALLGRRT